MRLGRWWLAAIVFGIMRLIVIDYSSLVDDPDAYRAIAEGWSATGTMGRLSEDGIAAPTAYRPPVYPWLLSWFVGSQGLWIPAVAALHILLGSLTCVLTLDLARRLSSRLSPRGELEDVREPLPSDNKTQSLESASRREATTREATTREATTQEATTHAATTKEGSTIGDVAFCMMPWLAGVAVAFDPILVRQSSLIMTETAAAFLSVLIWWVWVVTVQKSDRLSPFRFILIGVLLGISCLLRPSTLVWCALLVVALSLRAWRWSKSKQPSNFAFSNAIFLLVGIVITLSPWAIRNRIALGTTIWTTTHGGYTLLLANNPVLFQHLEDEGISRKWDEDRFHELWSKRTQRDPREAGFWNDKLEEDIATDRLNRRRDEVEDDRLSNEVAWITILRSPWTFTKACLTRVLWLWALWPFQENVSIILTILIGAWYLGISSFFAFGVFYGLSKWFSEKSSARSELEWLPAVTLIVGLTAIHVLYWSNMRMRGPMVPMIVVIAAIGISKIPFSRLVSYTKRS